MIFNPVFENVNLCRSSHHGGIDSSEDPFLLFDLSQSFPLYALSHSVSFTFYSLVEFSCVTRLRPSSRWCASASLCLCFGLRPLFGFQNISQLDLDHLVDLL